MTYGFLDRALLEQRQVLGLPTYKGDKKRDKNSSGRNEEDLVSLDHCTCPPDCPPKGINKVFTVPPRPDKDPSYETKSNLEKAKAWLEWYYSLFVMAFFSVLPAGFILVLYVIPTTHQRLWTILGETVFLISAIVYSGELEKSELFSYMLG